MNLSRRKVLRALGQGGLAIAAAALLPVTALAAWSEKAFRAKSVEEAMTNLLGSNSATDSSMVTLKAPEIAENGAVVPVSVKSTLENVESISIIVANNPTPLAASFEIPEGTLPEVAVRIRMGKTSSVTAIVKAGGKLYSSTKQVKVTIGGCGG